MTQSRQAPIGKSTDSARRQGLSTPTRTDSEMRARTLPLVYKSVPVYTYALRRPRGQRNELRPLRMGNPTVGSTTYHDAGQHCSSHGRVDMAHRAAPVREHPPTSDDNGWGSA